MTGTPDVWFKPRHFQYLGRYILVQSCQLGIGRLLCAALVALCSPAAQTAIMVLLGTTR